jgi:antitoxin component YwqK of YwqJK toxin-antitoxin module
VLKYIYLFLFSLLALSDLNAKEMQNNTNLPVKLLKNANCKLRKKDNISYCLDDQNKKITAELRKYEDGVVVRSIPVVKGLIDGTVKSYSLSGNLLYEKAYSKGKLNGLSITYHENNQIDTQIPYSNGLKEGIAKYYYENGNMRTQLTFVNNKLDGKLRSYTKDGETLFDIITAQNKYIEGTCKYIDTQDSLIKTQNIPDIFIEALNNNCISLGKELTEKCCSLDKTNISTKCNKKWLKNNIEQLKSYVKDCNQ